MCFPPSFEFQTSVKIFQTPTMAATARILRMSNPLAHSLSHEAFSSSTTTAAVSRARIIMCLNKERLSITTRAHQEPAGGTSRSVLVKEPEIAKRVDLGVLLRYVADIILSPTMNFVRKHRPWRFNIQMIMEKGIIDCRFFTLLAVAGSLVGSVLCFVEGCVLTLGSYFHCFHSISQMSEPVNVVPTLIEAIDMFLVGSAMFTFGMALHVMFVGQQHFKGTGSTLSRNFNPLKLRSMIGMETPMQAKSKIGHAVIMILQEQVLDKLKSVPVTNAVDLACFAGAVFLSSASLFILSRNVAARVETKI
ncbi:uncharacterized protein LOC127264390 [Andrographis paniculata]|uniref:uncharacterized protein LOC127264390 n=1 Tax=Andrographis paniculata TaxID=175694 RepID=UPI0021E84832|nr:uncharacterized protein LOC127264390 [Andrographis paniculata]